MTEELEKVCADAMVEVNAQLVKWGEQDHPCLDQTIMNNRHYDRVRMTQEYEIPSESRAKFLCEIAFYRKEGTFAHIAVEELSEIISEFEPEKRYNEVIQLAAVCLNWAAKIKRVDLKES